MKRVTRWLLPLLMLLPATVGFSAFTDDLTVSSKYAFIGDSWTSNSERPKTVGGSNYTTWADSGYYSQSAEWAYRLMQNIGARDYRVFATGGQQARSLTGMHLNMADAIAYDPDIAFMLMGINDCADATDSTTAYSVATTVIDSIDARVDQFHNIGSKVCLLWLHPCGNYWSYKADIDDTLRWSGYKEMARDSINTWIVGLTENDSFQVHTDFWLEDTLGQFTAVPIDCTVIETSPDYNKDNIHLTQLGNFARGDSIWAYTMDSLSFTDSPKTFYLDFDNGDDWSNAGTSTSAPFATLQQALFRVRPGDRVEVLTDSVDNYFSNTRETFAEIYNHGFEGSPITLDFNGNLFSDPYDANSRKVFYEVWVDTSYYTLDSNQVYYTITDAVFKDITSDAINTLGWGGLTVDECTFYNEDWQLNNSDNCLVTNSTFYGGGLDIDVDGNYAKVVDSYFEHNQTYSDGRMFDISDLDSLILIGCTLLNNSGEQSSTIYQGAAGDATDVYRIINCDITGDRGIYFYSGASGTFEMKNTIAHNAGGDRVVSARTGLTIDADNNFLYGDLYIDGTKNIAQWRTATGGTEQWNYAPSLSDTIRYGGTRPTVYADDVSIPHSSDWCSIGTDQYDVPEVPGRFATPADADSLITNLGWVWSASDTIFVTEWERFLVPHDLTLEYKTGVPQKWGGGWN